MSKWSSLTGGSIENASAPKFEKDESFRGWTTAIWVVAGLTVAIVLAITATSRGAKGSNGPTRAAKEEILTVVQANAINEAPLKTVPMIDESMESRGAVVTAKETIVASHNRYFESPEDLEVEAPFYDPDSGYSFEDFQRTFKAQREGPIMDRPVKHGHAALIDQLRPIQEDLKRSGKTFQEYMESQNMHVSEDLIDVMSSQLGRQEHVDSHVRTPMNENISAEEAMMLGREAQQMVPRTSSVETATVTLREILAARTEAATVGLALPPMSPEQRESVQYWANHAGEKVSSIAKTILSRA